MSAATLGIPTGNWTQDKKKKSEFETQRESSAQINYVKEEDYLPKSDHATLLKGGLEKISKL